MSTYSPDLRIELITTGDQAGTWGNTTNTNLSNVIEQAIAGYVSVSVTSANQALTYLNGGSTTAALNQSVFAAIALTTTTAANFNVYAPPSSKQYTIYNASAYTATLYNSTVIGNTTAAGTGAIIPAGKTVTVWSDGTNFSFQNNHLSSLTLATALPATSGGTGVSSFTASGVVYASTTSTLATGTALTFDGTNLTNSQSTAAPIGLKLNNASASTSAGTRLTFQFEGVETGYVGNQFDGSDFNNQYSTNRFHIWLNNGSEQMRLTSTGLGIGTSSPAGKLHVFGGRSYFGGASDPYAVAVGFSGARTASAQTYFLGATDSATPDLTFSSSTGVLNMTLTNSGNLGLGVTPSAWGSSGNLQMTKLSFAPNDYSLGSNYYQGDTYRYATNDPATRLSFFNGGFAFYTAPSGTAGNPITFTQAMTLDASGNLLVGTTSSLGKFTVAGVSGGGNSSAAFSRGTQALDIMAGYALTNGTQAGVDEPLTMTLRSSGGSTGNLALATGNTEHVRINAAGNFGIGTTSPTTKLDVNGTVTATTFAGAGTSLTGTATSLSIGGNAATATTAAGLSATLAVASGGTGVTTSTGSGNNVLSTSPTLTTPTLTGFTETVFAITDSGSVDINPANGTIQTWTLGANRTPTATSFANGQSVTLMIADGTSYDVTWTTINVNWVGGVVPLLPLSGYAVVVLWKVAGTVYGNFVGSTS